MPLDALLAALRPGGRDFERVCKWALENVPEYRQRLRHVWLWDDWPGRWGRDAGIDLVAEDHEGGLWAIQAKHYDPAYAIKKADLDSFLSESSRPGFTYRLVIASTDHLGPTARRTLDAQEKPVGTLLRSQLEALDVAWPTSLTGLRPVKPKRKRPRPHQRRAVAACARGLSAMDRGQLIMACGTGKTLVAPFLAERMAAKRVLVLVPSLSLLGQTLREWATATDFDYLAVCSDDTVTKDDHDAVVASTSELGVPVTTDAARIARFLRRRGTGTKVVIFSTYQSSPQIAAAQTGSVPAFDLVIADEAHRCAGPQAGVFATVLDPTKIKARKRLFMTATPRYFTGRVKREASEAEWEVASMDEEIKFGPVLYRLPFSHAIQGGLLSDYQVVVIAVTDAEALDLAARGTFVTYDGRMVTDARTLARQIGLLRAMAKHDLRRVVTFHSRIEYATRFASSLPDTSAWLPVQRRPSGSLWTDHVSGKMTAGERDARLRRLANLTEGERGVLSNARCLNEGVDLPTLDGVAFIDPRRSQVDVAQAVGRAIRKAPDKTVGSVVIPVLIDEKGDAETALTSGEFNRVWEVVRALRDHDDDLAEEIDELRRELGRKGSVSRRPGKIVLDIPKEVDDAFVRAFDARLIERTSAKWQVGFARLQVFVARSGHARVPTEHREDGYALGWWVQLQRARYQKRLLSADRIALLGAEPGWTWDEQDSRWEEGFAHLLRFIEREGHARVPIKYKEEGFPLGRWVVSQRVFYRGKELSHSGRPRQIAAWRVSRLEALPQWTWDQKQTVWDDGFAHLERFVAREGHARPSVKHVENGYRLGHWVQVQRRRYRRGALSPKRAERLDALPGWKWEFKRAQTRRAAWHVWLDRVERFVARTGHARVPALHREDGHAIGTWVRSQRVAYKHERLSSDQVARLEALPGWTWGRGNEEDEAT